MAIVVVPFYRYVGRQDWTTAYFAGMVAKYWFEQIARLPVEVELGSEFRYRAPPLPEGGVCIAVSQSGETADTLAAVRYAKAQKQHILAVVNVPESAIAREANVVLHTLAGPELSGGCAMAPRVPGHG